MRVVGYVKEAYNELMYKVTWPTWPELQSSAIIVMVAALIISLLILVMDLSFSNIMEFIYQMFY
ncbi:MAG: preprotein translocase subunit SecE [Bacteroidetes bacterium]|jgi:preprotein translocase subunit SecE|nr:preprotein translocase subunit SecE [Bacteroidota bacterium]